MVWADGKSEGSQSTDLALVGGQAGETWWPCIVVRQTQYSGLGFELIPFYCPALAWQRSRPWFVHLSRVRLFDRTVVVVSSAVSDDSESDDPARSAEVGTTSGASVVTEAIGRTEVCIEPDEEP